MCGGLGIGVGAYREEFEAVRPDLPKAHRGTMVAEGAQALRKLFSQRSSTFQGKYLHFEEVESQPKPLQRLPWAFGGQGPSRPPSLFNGLGLDTFKGSWSLTGLAL